MSDNPNDALARLKSVPDVAAAGSTNASRPHDVAPSSAPATAPPSTPSGTAPPPAAPLALAAPQPPVTPRTPRTPSKQPSKLTVVDKGKAKDASEAGPSGPPPASVTTGIALQQADEKTGKAAVQSLMHNDRALQEGFANFVRAVESRELHREQVHRSDMDDLRAQLSGLAAELVDVVQPASAPAVNLGPLVDAHNEIVDSVTQLRSRVDTIDNLLAVTQADTAANARALEDVASTMRALNLNVEAIRNELRGRAAPVPPAVPQPAPAQPFMPNLPPAVDPEAQQPLKRLRADVSGSSIPTAFATAAPAMDARAGAPATAPAPAPAPLGHGAQLPPPVNPTQPLPGTVVKIGALHWGKDITGQVKSLGMLVPDMPPMLMANVVARRQGKFHVLVTFLNANDAAHFIALWNASPPPNYRFLSVTLN